jgi:hypothetical protein
MRMQNPKIGSDRDRQHLAYHDAFRMCSFNGRCRRRGAAARFGPRVDADHFLAEPDAGNGLSAGFLRTPEFLKNLATSMWSGGS